MGETCTIIEDEKGYQRTGRWDPMSVVSNRRLLSTECAEDSDESADWNVTESTDLSNLALGQTNRNQPDAEEVATARRGFREAIQNGNDSLAMYIEEEYPQLELLETVFENGDLSLHVAVQIDDHKLMLYLLTGGLSPNRPNLNTGDTPLHYVCRGDKDTAKEVAILLKYGADPEIQNNNGQTPLDIAKARDNPDENVVEMMSKEIQRKIAQILMESPLNSEPNSKSSSRRPSVLIGSSDAFQFSTKGSVPLFEDEKEMSPPRSPRQVRFDLEHQDTPHIGDIDGDTFEVGDMKGSLPHGDPKLLVLTTEEAVKLEAHKIAQENPFGHSLKRTSVLLNGMLAISEADDRIPDLEGWLKKRNAEGEWKKKWVVVRGAFILWADRKIELTDVSDKRQRQKFNGHYNLFSISQIEAVVKGSKSQRKWQFSMGQKCKERQTKVFVWKAEKEKDRNDWVMGMKHRKELLNLYHGYLEDE